MAIQSDRREFVDLSVVSGPNAGQNLDIPAGHEEWLRADTIKPWRYQRDLSKRDVNKIAREFDPDTVGLLIISRRDGVDYLLDGQHRLAAIRDALGWGDQNVPCYVYEGLTDQQEAKIFSAQAPGKRRQLSPLHALYVAYEGGSELAVSIVRTVERAGLKIGWTQPGTTHNTVVAARALQDMVEHHGTYRTQRVLELLRDALGPTQQAYTAQFIKGMMAFHIRFDGVYDRAELVEKLRRVGYQGLTRETYNQQAANSGGAASGVGRAILKIYDKNRTTRALGDWIENFQTQESRDAHSERIAVAKRRNFEVGAERLAGRAAHLKARAAQAN